MTRVVALAALLLPGCFDFESEEEVIDLRVLAVQAEPPEVMVVVDLEAAGTGTDAVFQVLADPAPVQVTALVVNPRNDAPFSYAVRACVWHETYRCDAWEAVDREDVAMGTASPGEFGFGFAPTADRVNRWLAVDPYRGFGGLLVMLELRIEQPGEPVNHAAKLVTYNVPFVPKASDQDPPPPKLPNQNPVLTALKFDEVPTLEDTPPVELAAGAEVLLEPVFNEDATIEEYPVVRIPSEAEQELGYVLLTEKLEIEFYVTDGALSPTQLQSRDPRGESLDYEVDFTAPDDAGEMTMWVVIRDDRGGSSWVTRTILVGE